MKIGEIQMDNKSELNLWDLENQWIYIKVNEGVIRELFSNTIKLFGTQYKLAQFLMKSNGAISRYKQGSFFIPLDIVIKILNYFPEIQKERFKNEINTNLEKIRHGYGSSIAIKIKFPIKLSSQLAKIAGHLAGDGGINIVNRVFYSNKSRTLIELFKKDTEIVFGKTPYNEYDREHGIIVYYPTIIGLILKAFFGEMRNEQKKVPFQILSSDGTYQSFFLRALFDDEGNVSSEKCTVQINMTNKLIIKNMKKMLSNFGIIAGKITTVKRAGNRKDMYLFRISGREHLKLFLEKIGFDHPDKKIKLKKLIESYKYRKNYYGKAWLTKQFIINILKKNEEATKCQIAKELNRNPTALKYHLLKLESDKIISSRKEGLIKVYSLVNNTGVQK